ncbi:biotin--[acetyl-CoA-carboxylase] ligase [Nitriliruptor alkaliphilus]|uniref:biotin--[acetyl-CoA-carboxylase] ligase n=1 Tax=Nitriliruptor alkaliphilus TaxID=427918 RepID=UPI000697EA63|nr:biotin--[acetyl-CoA-carboxylase] ligase [Nitriliruptor alkaliphilus]
MTTLDHQDRIAALLGGPLGWHSLIHEPEVTSTSDVALQMVREGTPPGFVVVADHQTAGRGRQGRPWEDASAGDRVRSLTLSAAVGVPGSDASLTPLAVGLAVADALRRAGTTPGLKWPNDVLLPAADGTPAKTAGILVERHAVRATSGPDVGGEVLIVGIGVDLDWRDVPREGDAVTWTSVAEATGRDVDRADVLADVLRGLSVWLRSVPSDPLRLLVAYRDNCVTIGADVRVTFPDGEVLAGRAVDLDRQGRLVVEAAEVGQVAVTAGDVEHVRPT